VISTDPCTPPTTQGDITITPEIPSNIVGCAGFTGFTVADGATAFVKPDICRLMFSPTTKVNPDGTPVDGPNFVGVNFDTGLFTFDPSVNATNPELCFRETQTVLDFSAEENGIYFLVGVDEKGRRSPPSKPIMVGTIETAAPPKGFVGDIKILVMEEAGVPGASMLFESVIVADSESRRVLCPPAATVLNALVVGANGIDAGALAAETWYSIYAIGDSTGAITPDAGLLSTSPTAPTLPAGYDCFRRIGAARTNGSAGLIGFRQMGHEVYYEEFHSIFSGFPFGGLPSDPMAIVDASTRVPPIAQRMIFYAQINANSGGAEELRFYDGGRTSYGGPIVVSTKLIYATAPQTALVYSNTDVRLHMSITQTFRMVSSGAGVNGAAVNVRGFELDPLP